MHRRLFNKRIFSILLAWGLNPSLVFANNGDKVLSGELFVNQKLINGNFEGNLNNALIETNKLKAIINIENDFYLIRPETKLKFVSNRLSEIVKGSIHAIFSKRKKELKIKIPSGTIGIRGTSIFVDLEPEKKLTYFCNCHGETNLYGRNGELIQNTISKEKHKAVALTDDGKVVKYSTNYITNLYALRHASIFNKEMKKAGCKVENSHCVLL
tara:strand:+ start:151 stop:789 length:639 start_codon:yes stop_codon:yes gene_type:complete